MNYIMTIIKLVKDGERKLVTRIVSSTFKTDLRAGQVLSLTRQKQNKYHRKSYNSIVQTNALNFSE